MKRIFIMLTVCMLSAPGVLARTPDGDLLAGVAPGPDGKIDVVTVFAHQDDESFYGGGSLLKIKQDPRVRLYVICMTLGDMSDAKDHLGISSDHLGRIRTEELETAAAVYGAEQVIQFEVHDQGLAAEDQDRLVEDLANKMDEIGAEIVITHDPPGITGHTDHIACSQLATRAFERSGAQRLYYTTFPKWGYAMTRMMSPLPEGVEILDPTFKVDIRAEKKLKRLVLYSHATQKHFSGIGTLMEVVMLFNHEWFVLAEDRPVGPRSIE